MFFLEIWANTNSMDPFKQLSLIWTLFLDVFDFRIFGSNPKNKWAGQFSARFRPKMENSSFILDFGEFIFKINTRCYCDLSHFIEILNLEVLLHQHLFPFSHFESHPHYTFVILYRIYLQFKVLSHTDTVVSREERFRGPGFPKIGFLSVLRVVRP